MLLPALGASRLAAADLSPALWPAPERAALEQADFDAISPEQAQRIATRLGLVSCAACSPIAVYAGVEALRAGGSAADAAITAAITQITLDLGAEVSYAGIAAGLYYNAHTHEVASLDAGFNTYLGETDPRSIPVCDARPLRGGPAPTRGGAKGRETLVPGFFAGMAALHQRFGRLPWADLLAPAIYYADHGVTISPRLHRFFRLRARFLERTPEGRDFIENAERVGVVGLGSSDMLDDYGVPITGARFLQPALASTLRAVADQGAGYLYTGAWARDFVRLVRAQGGEVSLADLARYRVIWSAPYHERIFGHTLYVNGPPGFGVYDLFLGLNLLAAMGVDQRPPYWADPESFADLARVGRLLESTRPPGLNPGLARYLSAHGIDASPAHQLTPAYARALLPLLAGLPLTGLALSPHHSSALVVIDAQGNIAALTHSANATLWGDTGIVVDGVPVPDPAGFQQARLASIPPGARLPHEIIDTLAFAGDHPVLATAGIGYLIVPESLRVTATTLGQRQSLPAVMGHAPLVEPLYLAVRDQPLAAAPYLVLRGAYPRSFIEQLKIRGLTVQSVTALGIAQRRGTLAAVALDPATGEASAVDVPGVAVFNRAQ